MFLIVRADGKYWDGYGWNVTGKPFCTIGGATRSLYEEGEGTENTNILSLETLETLNTGDPNDSTPFFSTWYPEVS